MKLLGRTNGKRVVASISHYDCVSDGEGEDYIMADGGAILANGYAGYTRGWGEVIWFEIPETFAELYSDYQSTQASVNMESGILKMCGFYQKKNGRLILLKRRQVIGAGGRTAQTEAKRQNMFSLKTALLDT